VKSRRLKCVAHGEDKHKEFWWGKLLEAATQKNEIRE
jgi:hypothetical protein